MTVSVQDIIVCGDRRVSTGFNRVVLAVLAERDSVFDMVDLGASTHPWDFDGEAGQALDLRISVHTKWEEIVDGGDGRTAVDVVCFDGKPVAVVHEDGYDTFDHDVLVVDAEALQTMVDLAMDLRLPTLREVEVVSLDMDIAERFRLSLSEELEPSAPAP